LLISMDCANDEHCEIDVRSQMQTRFLVQTVELVFNQFNSNC
jgi:hypothetical protein